VWNHHIFGEANLTLFWLFALAHKKFLKIHIIGVCNIPEKLWDVTICVALSAKIFHNERLFVSP
jgi:hypothetical protein